ncbi:unnamed protein product [Lupinus luteus]|uniref:Late embryogenesis abundant protein LEA-2 subgroup domain-containing protein n=1 Tax=Lupinus luteus TaxID=3873 RepID=A0AAV1VRC5_LUPLU
MSAKECDHHKWWKQKVFRKIFCGIVVFLFIVLVTILLIWAILRPTKPTFILQDVTIYAFNATVPNLLTSNFQVTLTSRNPNDNIGIYYDRLDTYVNYRSQQITLPTAIPPSYQGHKEVDVWSPFVYGTNVPVAPFNFVSLGQDQNDGNILITIKIDGRVRWKIGVFITGHYHLYVRCPAYISFGGSRSNGDVVGENVIKYQLVQSCSVSV